MKSRFLKVYVVFFAVFLVSSMIPVAPLLGDPSTPFPTEWSEAFGGSHNEKAYSVIQTRDGCYVIAGENDTQDPAKRIYCAYENVSSEIKEFYSFTNHSHLDLLLGDYSNELIFPKITAFMDKVITTV